MHPLRQRYIDAGFITPRPPKLTLPELIERGFWAAVGAHVKRAKAHA